MILRSIGYRLFFTFCSVLGVALSYWQYHRAGREELTQGSQATALRGDLAIRGYWIYEKPDRSRGVLYEVQTIEGVSYIVSKEDYEGFSSYRSIAWNLPQWCDRQNLKNGETGEVITTLSILIEKECGKDGRLLKPVLSENERLRKQHRHYAYAVQWLALALASSYYVLRAKSRES